MIFIYNAVSILVIGFFIRKVNINSKSTKWFLFLSFLQMFLIQALRSSEVGTDTAYYVNVYDNFLNSEYYSFLFTHFELGFRFLFFILKEIGADAQVLLGIVSAVTMFCFAIFIYNNSKDIRMSTFLFACMFYPNSFNILRQYMAISIAINSYYFVKKEQYGKAILLIILASMFHTTAILMVVPLLLRMVKNWDLIRKLIILSSFMFFLFGNKIVGTLLPLLGKEYYLQGFEVNRLIRMTTILTMIFAIILWYFSKKMKNSSNNDEIELLSCIAFVNVDFGILYLRYEFFSRIIELMNLFLLVAIPFGVNSTKSRYRQIIILGTYILGFLLMLNAVYNSGSGVSEYSVFWK